MKVRKTHGEGVVRLSGFKKLGKGVVIEKGAMVFHPENIEIYDGVYIGHYAILKGYYKNKMVIKSGAWIGQHCFLHSAGGLFIGENVGIGPKAMILTSFHQARNNKVPVIDTPLVFQRVTLEDDCDIGSGAIILPGVTIGRGAIIGAGSVVTKSIPPFSVAVGNPAKVVKTRK